MAQGGQNESNAEKAKKLVTELFVR